MNDFNTILSRMLDSVSDSQDKRPSSIVYDSLAPTAAELVQAYITLSIFKEQMNLLTATGENLDNIASNFAISRRQATNAIRIAETIGTDGNPIDLLVGSRFSTPAIDGGINFTLTENLETSGLSLLTSETAGTIGNVYLGSIQPLFVINNLGSAAIIGTQIPADDTESDDAFRERIIEQISRKSFGGNIAAYIEFVKAVDGVGDLKVFPAWNGGLTPSVLLPPANIDSWIENAIIPIEIKEWISLISDLSRNGIISLGGGTVRLSIIDSSYNSITQDFINYIKNKLDPDESTGEGIGIAPIGHRVTVTTPKEFKLQVNATVMLYGATIGQIQTQAEENIRNYLLSLRKEWADLSVMNIFILKIANAILDVPGVINVPSVSINGESKDIMLPQTAELQQLPYLEVLTLNE